MKEQLYGLQVDFTNEHGQFMVLSDRDGLVQEQLNSFQVKMLTWNRLPRLLPLQLDSRDGNIQLYYSIEGKRMLSAWLRQESLTLKQFYQVLYTLTEVLDDSRACMLQPGRYILMEDYIFCGRGLDDLYLTYIPKEQLENKGSISSDLQHLASRLVYRVKELTGSGFQELMSYLQEESFSVSELKKLLHKHIAQLEEPYNTVNPDPRPRTFTSPQPMFEEELHRQTPITASPMGAVTADSFLQEERADDSKNKIKRQWLTAAMFVLLLALIWRLYAENPTELYLYICSGISLVSVGLAFVLFKKLSSSAVSTLPDEPFEPFFFDDSHSKAAAIGHTPSIPLAQDGAPDSSQHTVLLAHSQATVLLSPSAIMEESLYPRLEYIKNGKQEQVELRKSHFVIGRAGVEVDFVHEDKGVSRIHAEIIRENGVYVVKDLGSRNGTMLNGTALVPYRVYSLQDGDIVKIIRTDFTFRMGS
ncbi:DUF6382 domain-containing protein [Paenibacillus silviterrae]|uniref:DUF6382 domain-containing protein n=1 Tax=Paenibacillus silviterrae TaxID=3242194 RepID=UPI002543D594|nr:DUF6382 domain-containing protein [Paenibacillus chinjuensis]